MQAINSAEAIDVTASVSGDSFVITDNSGDTGTLRVRDVGVGTTATDLGLDGLTASGGDTQITGADVYSLTADTQLSLLNDGNGVVTGSDIEGVEDLNFRLRDGTTSFAVDLVDAQTLGDVIDVINNADGNDGALTASIRSDGRGLELTDNTGSTAANLIVTSNFGVAESFGIDTGDTGVDASSVSGRVTSGLKDSLVTSLNGGRGFNLGLIDVSDRSTDSLTAIDLSSAETLGEVVDLINAASGVQVEARINNAGTGILISDTSGGSGNLRIADTGSSTSATDLGIKIDSSVQSIDGGSLNRQTISLATRLEDLNGGRGVASGDFRITNSLNQVSVVDLNAIGNEAETIGDVIQKINDLSNGVTAQINAAGNGIELIDFAEGDSTLSVTAVGNATTAADLNLLGSSTNTNEDGRQTIDGSFSYEINLDEIAEASNEVSLASLNGGDGIDQGVFRITNSFGGSITVNLADIDNPAFTVEDVIDRINEAPDIGVSAAINNAGNGIALSAAPGSGITFTVEDLGSDRTAAQLGIAGESSAASQDDEAEINSGFLFSATPDDGVSLSLLADRVNALDAGFTASVIADLTGERFVITADTPGSATQLSIDAGSTGLVFSETSRGRDAVGVLGASDGGVVVRSATNTFEDVIDGLDITINQPDGQTVEIGVAEDNSSLFSSAETFVDTYNTLRTSLDGLTSFDEESLTTGILFGRSEANRVESELSRILTGRLIFGSQYSTLQSVGISLGSDGQLQLDRGRLSSAFDEDPLAVKELFTDDTNGLVTRINNAVDQLARGENSLLSSRSAELERTALSNDSRIETLTASLDRERERLLLEFINLEETIALLQSNTSAINDIQPISILSSGSSNSN